ncbi:galactosyltransferase domain-containing protein [Ditylenchus destructor]|uniref:Hexosyltransferase n=1 Tax=Ditylenchus destructor TaxID=166010 RepID=A0AAD4NDT6_9BILA|nr:galactosyltransferase domain-containing protein [Ditylenchus destructor]
MYANNIEGNNFVEGLNHCRYFVANTMHTTANYIHIVLSVLIYILMSSNQSLNASFEEVMDIINTTSTSISLENNISCTTEQSPEETQLNTPHLSFFDDTANAPFTEFRAVFANLDIPYNISIPSPGTDPCGNATLFVFIPTRPQSFDIRTAIRTSWASNLEPNTVVHFIVGVPNDPELLTLLLGEWNMFNDLILFDIPDTYLNLYLKIHAALTWQQNFCSNAKFILKTDDDTVVDISRLNTWIDYSLEKIHRSIHKIIFGGIWKGTKPIRTKTHKWYVPTNVYPGRLYPHYANGPTYLLSNAAVAAILHHTNETKAFPIEDILYTGVLAGKAGVRRMDVWRHFRLGSKINKRERCSGPKTPLLTAIYGFSTASDIASAFDKLHGLKCEEYPPNKIALYNNISLTTPYVSL